MISVRNIARLLFAAVISASSVFPLYAETSRSSSTTVGISVESNPEKGSDKVGVTIGRDHSIDASGQKGESGGSHVGYSGHAGVGAEVGVSVETKPGGVSASAGGSVSAEGSVKVHGQYGDDSYNLHGSGEIKVSAELVAELKAQLEASADGASVGIGGEIGASLSSEGVITGGVVICGVPVDVILSGKVSVGASASAGAGAEFDAKTGKLKLTLEASAVLGVGAGGSVQVEVGVAQLGELLIAPIASGTEKLVLSIVGDDTEYVQDLLRTSDIRERLRKILMHELKEIGDNGFVTTRVQMLLDWYDKGASPAKLFNLAWALVDHDLEKISRLSKEIIEEITAGDPLDSEPDVGEKDDLNGSSDGRKSESENVFRGVTPFKVY